MDVDNTTFDYISNIENLPDSSDSADTAILVEAPSILEAKNLKEQEQLLALFLRAAATNDTEYALNHLQEVVAIDRINDTDYSGMSALHWAAVHGNTVLIEKLLQANASVLLQDKWGTTPLSVAFSHRHKEAILLFLNDPKIALTLNKKNSVGQTVIHQAIEMMDLDVFLATLAYIPPKNGIYLKGWRDNFGRSPLAFSIEKGEIVMAVHLLQRMPLDWKDSNILCTLLHQDKIPAEDRLSLLVEIEGSWSRTKYFKELLNQLFTPSPVISSEEQFVRMKESLMEAVSIKFSVSRAQLEEKIVSRTFESFITDLRKQHIDNYLTSILKRYENCTDSECAYIKPETLKKVISTACMLFTPSQQTQSFLIHTGNLEVMATWKVKEGKPRLKLLDVSNAKYLGEGTFGTVLKVMKLHKPGQYVALKVAKNDAGPSAIRDINNESQLLTHIHSAGNIPGIQLKGTPIKFVKNGEEFTGFLAKYCDRGSLENVIGKDFKDYTNFPLEKALDVCYQLLFGVAYLETNGVHHGDIKPANILVNTLSNGDLDCRLSDFGGARTFEYLKKDGLWLRSPIGVHTRRYLPKKFESEIKNAVLMRDWDAYVELKQKHNVYALGLTLTEIFLGSNLESVSFYHIPLEMINLLTKMVAQNPKECINARQAFFEMKTILSNHYPLLCQKYEIRFSQLLV